ncbi:NAD-dependent epimerase/dehydratase family protein [Deinococcus altitudinis]|uniref:NAD-dependent epimerase/dehydratase family protein n=1 Tax=Deinococcus altitudinis TaxID=468914 RepID=UPI003892B0FB
MAKIFITGGLGFIGSHVAELAVAEGHEVAVFDNLSTGHRSNVSAAVTVFEADLRDAGALDSAVGAFRPDLISHQAAQASVPKSFLNPEQDAEVNVLGTLNLLESARRHGVERIVMASTGGAIYGEVPEGTVGRVGGPERPSTPYAVSKLAAEQYLAVYAHHHGLQGTVLRYSNVYGERQNASGEAGVVAIFCQTLLRGAAIRVNGRLTSGDRGCVRDYVYVGDVARANLLALGGHLAPVFDVGTGTGTDARTLAETLMSGVGVTAPIVGAEPRKGDVQRSVLDGAPLLDALGEVTPLGRGLARTFGWYQQTQEAVLS